METMVNEETKKRPIQISKPVSETKKMATQLNQEIQVLKYILYQKWKLYRSKTSVKTKEKEEMNQKPKQKLAEDKFVKIPRFVLQLTKLKPLKWKRRLWFWRQKCVGRDRKRIIKERKRLK